MPLSRIITLETGGWWGISGVGGVVVGGGVEWWWVGG